MLYHLISTATFQPSQLPEVGSQELSEETNLSVFSDDIFLKSYPKQPCFISFTFLGVKRISGGTNSDLPSHHSTRQDSSAQLATV